MDHSSFMKNFTPSGLMEFDPATNQFHFLYPHNWYLHAVCAKVFWATQVIWSDVINEHTGPNQILSDRKTYSPDVIKLLSILKKILNSTSESESKEAENFLSLYILKSENVINVEDIFNSIILWLRYLSWEFPWEKGFMTNVTKKVKRIKMPNQGTSFIYCSRNTLLLVYPWMFLHDTV
jgi:hypothetical protein